MPEEELPILKKNEDGKVVIASGDDLPVLKKKTESTPLVSSSPFRSFATESPSTDGALDSLETPNYLGGNISSLMREVPQQPVGMAPPTPTLDPLYNPIKDGKFTDTPVVGDQQNILSAIGTPAAGGTGADQELPIIHKDAGNIEEALMRGTANLGNSFLKTPAFLYDIGTSAVNKVINEPLNYLTNGALGYMPNSQEIAKNVPEDLNAVGQIDNAIANSRAKYEKKYDKSISEYIQKGDYSNALDVLGLSIAEAAPTTIALMMGNAAGMTGGATTAAGTVVFGADKYSEIQKEQEKLPESERMSPEMQQSAALANGFFEGLFEQYGVTKLGGIIKNVAEKEGVNAAAKMAKDGFIKVYGPMMRKYLGVVAEESIGEMATQVMQNAVDKYSGIDPNKNIFGRDVIDAGLVGLGMSGPMAGATGAVEFAVTKNAVKRASELKEQKQALEADLQNENVPDDTKEAIVRKIRDVNEEEAVIANSEKKKLENLAPDQQEEVQMLLGKSKKISEAALDENISDDTRNALKEEAAKIDDQIDEVFKTKDENVAPKEADAEEPQTDKEMLDYLSNLESTYGSLSDEEYKQKIDLEKKLNTNTTSPASGEVPVENKSPESDGQETSTSATVAQPEATIKEPEKEVTPDKEIADLEKQIKKNKLDFFNEKISTKDYNDLNDQLNKELIKSKLKKADDLQRQKQESAGDVPATEVAQEVKQQGVEEAKPATTAEEAPKTQNHGEEQGKRQGQGENVLNAQPEQQEVPQEEAPPAPKKEKIKNELIDEETPDVKDSEETIKKLDDDLEAMKQMKTQDLSEKKFVGMVERAWKAKEEGKISRKAYTQFRNAASDILEGKVSAKDSVSSVEAKLKVSKAMDKIKDKLLGQGYNKITLASAIPVTPKNVADMIDLATKLIHRGIDAGFTIAQATQKALDAIKKHPTYKQLVKNGMDEKAFEKDMSAATKKVETEAKKEEPKKEEPKKEEPAAEKPKEKKAKKKKKKEVPVQEDGKREKSMLNRLYDSENVSEDTKEALKSYGLDYDAFSNKEANEIAKGMIDIYGPEGAIIEAESASSEFPASVKTMVYSNVIDYHFNEESKAKTPSEKSFHAKRQGEVADRLDRFVRDAGRAISALNLAYEISPAGMIEEKIAGLINYNNELKRQGGLVTKKNEVVNALKEAEKTAISEPAPPKDKKDIKKIREKRAGLLDQLKNSFKNPPGPQMKSALPLRDDQVVLIAKIAATYIEEGAVHVNDFIKKLKSDVKKATGGKISDADIERVMNEKIGDKKIKDSIMPSKPKDINQQLKEQRDRIEKKKRSELNRLLPKKRNQTATERATEHEKILAAYNNGAFDGSGVTYVDPKTGEETHETFEDLFYQKYGLVNVNNPEFRDQMKNHAQKIQKTPKNSALRNQAYQDMYDYIQKYHAKDRAALVGGIWYANILSSYETHLRNLKYNSTTVAVNQTLLLAQKALLKGNFREFANIAQDGLKAFMGGYYEAREILKDGQVSRFDNPGVKNELERSTNAFLKLWKIPGRALRASDILFTVPLYEMKQRELMSQYVRKEAEDAGVKISDKEVEQKVIEYLGRTPQRLATAQKTAETDIENVFGPNWKDNKKAVANYHIRLAEVMEQTRPEAVKKEAIEWAKRSLLTSKPRGIWGLFANGLNTMAAAKIGTDKFYVSAKAVIPFVNVMMNLADRMIERTPIGIFNAVRGKKGVGKNMVELTKDERFELGLKALNYTIGVGALMLSVGAADDDDDVVITGKNTGDYSKDQSRKEGGQLDPYSVYIKGKKVMEYKDSPMSSLFAPVGYYRDYVKYGEHDDMIGGYIAAGAQYLSFVIDQNAMKGLNDFLSFLSPKEYASMDANRMGKALASSAQSLYMPNIVKATNNDVRGALGMNDYKVDEWPDAFFKDIPFAENLMLGEKYDHLGQPVKDQFKIPLVPYEKWQPVDKYYKSFTDHKFYPTYIKDDVAVVGNSKEDSDKFTEQKLSSDQMRSLHQIRGSVVKEILNTKTEDDKTVLQLMDGMDNEEYKKKMTSIFSKAGKIAKSRLFNGLEIKSKTPKNIEEMDVDAAKSVNKAIKEYVDDLED